MILPRFVLVKTQVTVSPGCEARSRRRPRCPSMELVQPVLGELPAGRARSRRPSRCPGRGGRCRIGTGVGELEVRQPSQLAMKSKAAGRPAGSVTFSTMILPRFALVKTQVTVSPGSRLISEASSVPSIGARADRAGEVPAGRARSRRPSRCPGEGAAVVWGRGVGELEVRGTRVPAGVEVEELRVEPAGSVTLSTMIVAALRVGEHAGHRLAGVRG